MSRTTASTRVARLMRHRSTDAERRLWAVLRNRQLSSYKFQRQHPVGPYIADFACVTHRLIIEADGSQHADNIKDTERTAALEKWGLGVLHFWNPDILQNTQGVLETILNALQNITNTATPPTPLPRKMESQNIQSPLPPHPTLSPSRGRGKFPQQSKKSH